MKVQLKKGNNVKVLSGNERGKIGEILEILKVKSKKDFLNKRANFIMLFFHKSN